MASEGDAFDEAHSRGDETPVDTDSDGSPDVEPLTPLHSKATLQRPRGCAVHVVPLRDGGFALRFMQPWKLLDVLDVSAFVVCLYYAVTNAAEAYLLTIAQGAPLQQASGSLQFCAFFALVAWARGHVCLRGDELRFDKQRWTLTQPRLTQQAWPWWFKAGPGTTGPVQDVAGAKVQLPRR